MDEIFRGRLGDERFHNALTILRSDSDDLHADSFILVPSYLQSEGDCEVKVYHSAPHRSVQMETSIPARETKLIEFNKGHS